MTTKQRKEPSPEELAAQQARRAELRDREREIARLMRDKLRDTKRLPERDRPLVVRNLGRMLETAWRDQARKRAVEVFATAYPHAEASYAKKRARFMRFEGEPLPQERFRYGEYAGSGVTFLKLAEAHAALRYGEGDEDARLQVVLSLLEGTSLDMRLARQTRGDVAERQGVARVLDRIRDEVLRENDLVSVFEAFAKYPLDEHCDLIETVRLPLEPKESELLARDMAKLGLDLAALRSMAPSALKRKFAGRTLPYNWKFQRSVRRRKLVIEADATRLDPRDFVAGSSAPHLHWVVPRLRIGTAYLPGWARCVDLDLDPKMLQGLDEKVAVDAIETALDAALGRPATDPNAPGSWLTYNQEIGELWNAALERPGSPAHRRVFWLRIPLYLLLVPFGAADNPGACLWVPRWAETSDAEEYIAEVGKTLAADRPFDWLGGEEVLYEPDKVVLFHDDDVLEPDYDDFHGTLLTGRDDKGLGFLLGHDVNVINRHVPSVTVEEVAERRRAFVRVEFEDPYDSFTDLRHDSLAAAMTRNMLHARPDQRLSRRLIAENPKYGGLVADFLTEERERLERAWEA